MKKWIRLNLVLTAVVAGVLVLTAAKSSRSAIDTVFYSHEKYCWRYYAVELYSHQVGCNADCPPGCTEIHLSYDILNMIECECPDGLFYNPDYLTCDYPDRVKCPHATDCHTANRDDIIEV